MNSRTAWSDAARAHFVIRLVLGINIAVHGLSRIAHATTFAEGMTHDFANTWLPSWSVYPFAIALPFIELIVGACITIGFRLRDALMLGGLVIAALTFGTCLRQLWEIAGLQLIYAGAYAWLLASAAHARGTVDGLVTRNRERV